MPTCNFGKPVFRDTVQNSFGEAGRITGLYDLPTRGTNRFSNGPYVGRYNWNSARLCLKHRSRQTFIQRSHAEDIKGRKNFADITALAEQDNLLAKAELSRSALKCFALGPITHKDKAILGP
jgi:hypothetical protein